ncbi:MAG: hypothetical protein QM504_03995 [Pseudomonadota bacterium]
MLKIKIVLMIQLFTLFLHTSSLATPAHNYSIPQPITAYFVFPAGREPDVNGDFEVEIYYKAHFPIDKITVYIGHSSGIVFDPDEHLNSIKQTVKLFEGQMAQNDQVVRRIKAKVTQDSIYNKEKIPASLALYIDYLFPITSVIQSIQQNPSLIATEKEQMINIIMKKEKSPHRSIIKALAIQKKSNN